MIAHRSDARRIATALAAVGAVLLTASCAAGQHAITSEEVSTIDGGNGSVGSIKLVGVAIHAPSGASYAEGSSAQVSVVVVNNAESSDTLDKVSSPAFSGWGIVPTASATSTSVTGAGTPTSIPPGSSLRLGLKDLGTSAAKSSKTLVLSSLAKNSSPLFPGTSVMITFSFAKAGSTTLAVPVQLGSTPNEATLPAPSGSAAQG